MNLIFGCLGGTILISGLSIKVLSDFIKFIYFMLTQGDHIYYCIKVTSLIYLLRTKL